MLSSKSDFYLQAKNLVTTFENLVKLLDLKEEIIPDHICYKCQDSESFEKIRSFFETDKWIHQSIISQRRIAVIGLSQKIVTAFGDIDTLELSDQKPDGSQQNGFDHIEFLIQNLTTEKLQQIAAEKDLVFEYKFRTHHSTFDLKFAGFIFRLTEMRLKQKIATEGILA